MLRALAIRNIVLIEALDLEFAAGLTVLTGETGAGKSIILDSLSLALGQRAERTLVRQGAEQASVTAEFLLPADHPALAQLVAADHVLPEPGEPLILRRTLLSSGGGRAFINDEPVAAGLLRSVGETLVEIHGQHDERGLLEARGHRALLDAFAGEGRLLSAVAEAFARWQTHLEQSQEERRLAQAGAAEREYLEHIAEELARLNPQADEETRLVEERTALVNAEKYAADFNEALACLQGEAGLEARLGAALRRLERARAKSEALVTPAAGALERALIEAREASDRLEDAVRQLRHDPVRLEAVDDRLAALRAAARKLRVAPHDLAAKREEVEGALARAASASDRLARAEAAAARSQDEFLALAGKLSEKRRAAAGRLDAAVNAELAPLRLGRAQFMTEVATLPLERAGPAGLDRVEFRVRTNEGAPGGPLAGIASGGELSRFILALKVVLARAGSAAALVFDEVDQGVGGAVADAVGERLARLSAGAQVLVVTHAPQVAARGHHHFKVAKAERQGRTGVSITHLGPEERREEIARMLAGSTITDEARAAAARLLEGSAVPPPPRRKKAVPG